MIDAADSKPEERAESNASRVAMARVERLSAMQAMYLHSVLRQGGFDAEMDQKDDGVYTLSICAEDAEEKLARARAFVRDFRDGMVVCRQLKEEMREL